MRDNVFGMGVALFCLSSLTVQAQNASNMTAGHTLQILIADEKPYVIDAKGKKVNLSFGTILNATADVWSAGSDAPIRIDPKTIAMIRFEQTSSGTQGILIDMTTKKEIPLNLGTFLGSSGVTYPGCNAQQINGQDVTLNLSFTLEKEGYVQAYLTGPKNRKEAFNLGVMLREVVSELNQCSSPK